MKSITRNFAALAAFVILAACGGGAPPANAAEPVIVQNGSNGLYVVDGHARMVSPYTAEQIRITRDTGGQDYIAASAYNTLRTRLAARGWVELYNGGGLINPGEAINFTCANGLLNVGWALTGPQTYSDPGCGTYGALNARAQTQQ